MVGVCMNERPQTGGLWCFALVAVVIAFTLAYYGNVLDKKENGYFLTLGSSHKLQFCAKPSMKHTSLLKVNVTELEQTPGTSVNVVQQSSVTNKDNDAEAIAALHLAKEMLHKGKREKSLKLYQHAVSLSPHHSDILNDYGEFLENSEKDIVNAEHMYCRALIVNSSHDKALENRKRTLPVVDEIDRKHLRYIETKRDFLSQVPEHNPALRRVKRENYFKHIHHSTAIEGNTFTLAQTRALIETGMAIAGKSIVEHNEILGMDAALTFMNTSLVHRIGNIVLQDILDLHLRVLGYVDPVAAGRFRTTQVYVGNLVPPPANELSTLMNDFIEWLNSDDANQLHPIQLAALAHYTLVAIHPFIDGNGRTSRLLTNLILMQAGYPPVTILNEDKHLYYRQLNVANDGDVRPFIRFITKYAEDTLDEYLWLVSGDPSMSKPKLGRTNSRIIILEGDDDVS